MNNIEAFEALAKAKFSYLTFAKTIEGSYLSNSIEDMYQGFCLASVNEVKQSQAQQPTDLSKQLREYAADSGYSHNDYADTMLAAAYEIERCAARLETSQVQQTESKPLDFVRALNIADSVFSQYKNDHFKWWRRMDGTPILNDVSVRMAQAFVDAQLPPAPEGDKP